MMASEILSTHFPVRQAELSQSQSFRPSVSFDFAEPLGMCFTELVNADEIIGIMERATDHF